MGVLSEELREQIRAQFPKYPNKRAVVLPALHMVQDAQRHVSIEAVREIAELLLVMNGSFERVIDERTRYSDAFKTYMDARNQVKPVIYKWDDGHFTEQ